MVRELMSTLKLSSINLGSRLAVLGVTIVNIVLLARALGPEGLGKYFLLMRLVSLLAVLADPGLGLSARVFTGAHEDWADHIHTILLRSLVVLWASASVLGAGVLRVAGETLIPNLPRGLMWMSFAILPLVIYGNFWNGMMVGLGRIWLLSLLQVIIGLLYLILNLVFIVALSGGVLAAAIVYLAAMLIQALVMFIIMSRLTSGKPIDGLPVNLRRQMLYFGLRAYPGSISQFFWSRVPVFILNAFHGPVAVGVFSTGQQLVERLLLPVEATQNVLYHKMSVLSRRAATHALNRYLRFTLWAMLAALLAGVALAPWVVVLLFGEEYARAIPVCRVLLCGTAMTAAGLFIGTYFLTQLRRPGVLSIIAIGNALVNLLLAVLFIPRLAEVGAALSMSLAQIMGALIAFALYLRISRTRVVELIFISDQDVMILRKQVGAMLWWKGSRG
jgi:O-antigen/teichoic acid export membrane protein